MYIDGRQIRRQNKTEKCRGIWMGGLKLPLGLSQRSIRNKKLHCYPKGPVIIFDSEGVGDFFKGSHALQEERNGKIRCQLIVVRIIYFKVNIKGRM